MKVRNGRKFIRKEEKRMIYLIEGRNKLDIKQITVFLFTFWETHTRSETTSENLYVQIKEGSLATLFVNRLRLYLHTVTFN